MRIGIVPALNLPPEAVFINTASPCFARCEWKEEACEDEFIVFAQKANLF